MNTNELNDYIKNYLDNDKTQRAIMLTAPWGSGKSYYIKNSLRPFLFKEKKKYAVVSLYGIKDLNELNKSLYIELKANLFSKPTETQQKVNILGRTIIKGITSFFGIDISQDEEQWQKLYKSINLADSLIIFEDIERSGIDIIEFLGYVNSITENDGAKVLLVANEDAMLKQKEIVINEGKTTRTQFVYDDRSIEYLEKKEKTIFDTIYFDGFTMETVKSIYGRFDNKILQELLEDKIPNGESKVINFICDIMQIKHNYNYRSLIYALQKTSEFFDKINVEDYNTSFLRNLLLGMVAHCLGSEFNKRKFWNDKILTSSVLGDNAFPLNKSIFNYIVHQRFDKEELKESYSLYLKAAECAEKDAYLKVIYNYYVFSEKEVNDAVLNICNGLENDEGILYNEYLKIANYLLSIKSAIGNEQIIDRCIAAMVINLSEACEHGEEVKLYLDSGIQLDSKTQEEFDKIKQEFYNIFDRTQNKIFNFDYNAESISEWYYYIANVKDSFIQTGFAQHLDIDRIIEVIRECSVKQIFDLRGVFLAVYRNIESTRQYFYGDFGNLFKLKEYVSDLISFEVNMDAVKKYHLNIFIEFLSDVIKEIDEWRDDGVHEVRE